MYALVPHKIHNPRVIHRIKVGRYKNRWAALYGPNTSTFVAGVECYLTLVNGLTY